MLSLVLVVALTAAQAQQPAQPATRDTTKSGKQIKIVIDTQQHDTLWRRPLTPELLANAYANERARAVVRAARAARLAQDSSIVRYEAISRNRISIYLRAAEFGRDHLISRIDKVARV